MELNDFDEIGYRTSFRYQYTGTYQKGVSTTGEIEIKEDKMCINFGEQQLTFYIISKSAEEITGTYYSTNPTDNGVFTLIPGKVAPPCQFSIGSRLPCVLI